MSHPVEPSTRAREAFDEARSRISNLAAAKRLWDISFDPQDRERLGNSFEDAYQRYRVIGMWTRLRGVSTTRAVIDVANKVGFLREDEYPWLLREFGEDTNVDEAMDRAKADGHLVLVETPREAHWRGNEIEIDWHQHGVLWEFLWKLGRYGKAGRSIDAFAFGGRVGDRDIVAKRKSRLTKMPEFPVHLGDLIRPEGQGSQRLDLPAEQIRIFAITGLDTLSEWTP